MRKQIVVFSALAAIALPTTGCSGSGDSQTNPEDWANDVCASISTWDDAIAEATTTLGDPGNLSVNDFKSALTSVVDATEAFVADVGELGPPDTEAGEEAEEQLQALSDDLRSESDVLTGAIDADADTITELLANLSTITGALSTMTATTATTLDSIGNLDGAAELERAFESAQDCQQLQSRS